MILTIRETRHGVLLAHKDRREHRNTGNSSLPRTQGIMNALKRPFVFLAAESIVQFAAAYNGYLYGLSYLFNSTFVGIFGPEDYGFGTISIGLCFLVIVVEIIIGPITNALFQEPYFKRQLRKNDYKNIPEGIVMIGKFAAAAFPISLLLFAWTSYKSVHWIVPVLASMLWGWSVSILILMTYTCTEDSYKVCSDFPMPLSSP
jgi:hypothetical protein